MTVSVEKSDSIVLLVGRWRTVALCACAGIAIAVAYSFLAPKWYTATLTVVPSQKSQESAASKPC
jgi:uncharacterized protein involved in exopolysaccharide biosynthesis